MALMSPKNLNYMIKTNKIDASDLDNNKKIKINGISMDAYSDIQKEFAKEFPNLGIFGFNFLNVCRKYGINKNPDGLEYLHRIENYFNGEPLCNSELEAKVTRWYDGDLSSCFDMEENDILLAKYLKSKIE